MKVFNFFKCRALANKIVAKGPRNFAIKCLKAILTHDVAKNFTYTGRLMENVDLPPFEDTMTNAAIFGIFGFKLYIKLSLFFLNINIL